MKKCPQCDRHYTDETLNFCLDDGEWLLDGQVADEPATAIFHDSADEASRLLSGESPTRFQLHTTDKTAIFPSAAIDPKEQSLSANRSVRHIDKRFWVGLLFLVIVVFGGYFGYRYFLSSGKQISSIAVMPFVNASGNSDVDYLSDGMTETLIRSLSQLPNLSVKSRSSVFRYKGKDTDAKIVGNELGVQAVLNGRVTQRGDQLTLDLELINTETDNVIWTDEYDRRSSDLVSLQNDIARDVSSKLKLKLTNDDQQKLAKNYAVDPEAYRLYLQGRFYWNKRAGREFEKAESYFQQAIEKDPNFALGYVGLADTDEDVDRPQKKEYIRRALEIDPDLAEAHASLGYQYMLDYNWAESEREMKRAIELNPNYAQAYQWNCARLMMLGRYDDAMSSIKRALELDPTSTGINFYYSVLLFVSGKTDESIEQLNRLAEIEPDFVWAHTWLYRIYRQTGNHAAAVEERAKAFEVDGQPEKGQRLRESFAKGGWNGYLNEFLRLEAYYSGTYKASNIAEVSVLAELGKKDEAMSELLKSAEKGDFWLFTIKTDRFMDSLRNDSRFQALVKKFDEPQ